MSGVEDKSELKRRDTVLHELGSRQIWVRETASVEEPRRGIAMTK
jgi:hypothetical protein